MLALMIALATLTAPDTLSVRSVAATDGTEDLIARWVRASSDDRPRINVWVNREDAYQRGDRARVYFKADRDAYVTIVRIDTDGRVRILFPIDPWEDNWARADRTFEVLGRDDDEAFRVDDYPGVGYIFAIASTDEFNYDEIVRGDHWDYRNISDGRVRGDPYVAVSDLAERIAREGDFDYDVSEYYVEKHYDYPRFVCYDCHTYATYRYWDPYSSYCSRFRIVIYNDWYYYPYRRYGGVYYGGRPYRPGPRYVFKDSDPRNDYITRVAERPRNEPVGPRRPPEGRTSADVGGRGSIPTPRRRVGQDGQQQVPGGGKSEPRRRIDGADAPRNPGVINDQPTDRNDPRRRITPDNNDRPSVNPPAPRNEEPRNEQPRRRGIEEREAKPRGNDNAPSRRPESSDDSRRSPVTREPSRGSDRDRAEPRRAPERSEPRAQPRSEPQRAPERRAEPQRAPERRAEPQREQPRSTGEPSLKRRRPN